MAVPQITIRLSAASKAEFQQYAESFGLRASELFKVLIVRERKRRRLAKLHIAGELPRRARRPVSEGSKLPTITAHMSSVQEVTDFDAYAHSCGLKRDGAGALILEAELKERWLERALQEPIRAS